MENPYCSYKLTLTAAIPMDNPYCSCKLTRHRQDYAFPTPQWGVYGHEARGFSPNETRVYRNAKYKATESGCG